MIITRNGPQVQMTMCDDEFEELIRKYQLGSGCVEEDATNLDTKLGFGPAAKSPAQILRENGQ